MKYLFISLLSLIVFFESCVDSTYVTPKGSEYELDNKTKVETHSYQGCEYIVVGYGNTQWGSHKGNCNNPIHKQYTKDSKY